MREFYLKFNITRKFEKIIIAIVIFGLYVALYSANLTGFVTGIVDSRSPLLHELVFALIVSFILATVIFFGRLYSMSGLTTRIQIHNASIAIVPLIFLSINFIFFDPRSVDQNFLITTFLLFFSAINEELVFRGMIFGILWGGNKNAAIWLSILLFSMAHFVNIRTANQSLSFTLMQVSFVVLLGIFLTAFKIIFNTIFVPILFHFISNVGSLIFDTYAQVNLSGTEAVLIIFIPMILLSAYSLYFLYSKPKNNLLYAKV